MKNNAMILLGVTTLILVLLVVFSLLNLPFPPLFYGTVIGKLLLIFTVYKVLIDDYKTTKTFDDFYEDHPH